MKRVYFFLFAGVSAIVLIVVSIITFNPAVEKWSSLFAGIAFGLLLVGMPSLVTWIKSRRQKSTK
jgi:hypothetical protein